MDDASAKDDNLPKPSELPMEAPISMNDIHGLMAELRGMAVGLLRNESGNHSVCPTALVLTGLRRYKVKDQDWTEVTWNNRRHCFGSMHMMMRRALIDYARRKTAEKRPRLEFVSPTDLNLYELTTTLEETPERIVALEDALDWLASRSPALAELVQCHYFSQMSLAELAVMLESSPSTLKRQLSEARLLLHQKMLTILNSASKAASSP